jgi:hypothetical protein
MNYIEYINCIFNKYSNYNDNNDLTIYLKYNNINLYLFQNLGNFYKQFLSFTTNNRYRNIKLDSLSNIINNTSNLFNQLNIINNCYFIIKFYYDKSFNKIAKIKITNNFWYIYIYNNNYIKQPPIFIITNISTKKLITPSNINFNNNEFYRNFMESFINPKKEQYNFNFKYEFSYIPINISLSSNNIHNLKTWIFIKPNYYYEITNHINENIGVGDFLPFDLNKKDIFTWLNNLEFYNKYDNEYYDDEYYDDEYYDDEYYDEEYYNSLESQNKVLPKFKNKCKKQQKTRQSLFPLKLLNKNLSEIDNNSDSDNDNYII